MFGFERDPLAVVSESACSRQVPVGVASGGGRLDEHPLAETKLMVTGRPVTT